ncbi:FlxA-like family protein [Achromobacter deleyi]|jgi:cephalosporin hydroxylase|uniref:FlxA-like family protein n=1 Tax=Achromobacter deleyi TaxID=1353891 RepID=UPI00149318FA|nr:FlxA-like family protein [Achromobacter deleyi]QVQ26782.1 FlxA-like family protein [Achromobacter deleyi]UIP22356.1 FlxA-like family protein [Achromobacter deleyi]
MAINSISGTSRIGSLADLWAEKIQASKEAKNAAGQDATSLTADGKVRINNPAGMKVADTQAAEETDNDDEYTRQIKELQKQLKRIMDQIAKVKASGMSAEMKAQQVLALNAQAVQIQGQIAQVMAQQARAGQGGGVSATA